MDLKRKLATLGTAGPGTRQREPLTEDGAESAAPDPRDAERHARIAALRGQLHSMMARPSRATVAKAPRQVQTELLPFVRLESAEGVLHTRTRVYESTQRHGTVPLHVALEARGDGLSTLALDPSLRALDPQRALYLDTETTGLSGGTGTLAFLIGIAAFDGRKFCVEQLFLDEPSQERAMLLRLAARIEAASVLVTYNGKAFDMPLLRSRFVMARVTPPKEPPHLDLVHIARRIYGARLDECRLTSLERDVLGFVREGDVPSGEIPARYAEYLRSGDPGGLLSVLEHNLWDVIAMAALVGELSARVTGGDAAGRFEPADMAGLARTALRAGAETLAIALARDAALEGVRLGQTTIAARANTFAADIHRRKRDHFATQQLLLDALALAPDDGEIHLALAKLYEHGLRDLERAIEHAERAASVEEDDAHLRRLRRLRKRLERKSLPLPGVKR